MLFLFRMLLNFDKMLKNKKKNTKKRNKKSRKSFRKGTRKNHIMKGG
jgi:hypothetical protein